MEMSLEAYNELKEENVGYCGNCDEITQHGDVEPDAHDRPCPKCELNMMMGLEQALFTGDLEIK